MDLSITGTVLEILEEQSGTGRNGPWRKQDFIVEVPGEYPKKVCVTQWTDNIDKFGIKVGETLKVHIDIQSREYNGRWYTDVKAWKVERPNAGDGSDGPPDSSALPPPEEPADMDYSDDELPF